MDSNAHQILTQCKDIKVITQLVKLQILLPEILCLMHDLYFFGYRKKEESKEGGGGGEEEIEVQELIEQLDRINHFYNIVNENMLELIQNNPILAFQNLQNFVSNELLVISPIQKPDWMTNNFLVLLCLYYEIDYDSWKHCSLNLTPIFKESLRSFALYLQASDSFQDKLALIGTSEINMNEILASCFSFQSPKMISKLLCHLNSTEQESYSLTDNDIEMLLKGVEEPEVEEEEEEENEEPEPKPEPKKQKKSKPKERKEDEGDKKKTKKKKEKEKEKEREKEKKKTKKKKEKKTKK